MNVFPITHIKTLDDISLNSLPEYSNYRSPHNFNKIYDNDNDNDLNKNDKVNKCINILLLVETILLISVNIYAFVIGIVNEKCSISESKQHSIQTYLIANSIICISLVIFTRIVIMAIDLKIMAIMSMMSLYKLIISACGILFVAQLIYTIHNASIFFGNLCQIKIMLALWMVNLISLIFGIFILVCIFVGILFGIYKLTGFLYRNIHHSSYTQL